MYKVPRHKSFDQGGQFWFWVFREALPIYCRYFMCRVCISKKNPVLPQSSLLFCGRTAVCSVGERCRFFSSTFCLVTVFKLREINRISNTNISIKNSETVCVLHCIFILVPMPSTLVLAACLQTSCHKYCE